MSFVVPVPYPVSCERVLFKILLSFLCPQAGSSTVSSEAGLGISWTELEPTLYGRATQRRSSCPVPTDRYDEHLNDIIVHNMQDRSRTPWADSQDRG